MCKCLIIDKIHLLCLYIFTILPNYLSKQSLVPYILSSHAALNSYPHFL